MDNEVIKSNEKDTNADKVKSPSNYIHLICIFALIVMAIGFASCLLPAVSKSGLDEITHRDMTYQSLALREHAKIIYNNAPDGDVTDLLIHILGDSVLSPPDERFSSAMYDLKLVKKDNFPRSLDVISTSIITGDGAEIRVIKKSSEYFVEFIGRDKKQCNDVYHAECIPRKINAK